MIRATVLNGARKEAAGLGEFNFVQLPAAGDHILLGSMSGSVEREVQYVEHHPVPANPSRMARKDAYVNIVVLFLEERMPPSDDNV